MKKNVLIISAAILTISLTAFGFIKQKKSNDCQTENTECAVTACQSTESDNDSNQGQTTATTCAVTSCKSVATEEKKKVYPNFTYDIGIRFSGVSKTDLQEATSISEFIHRDEMQRISSLNSVEIILIENDERTNVSAFGESEQFTDDQLEMLQSLDVSSNFLIRIDGKIKNYDTGKPEFGNFSPHLTVVPEKQAEYKGGLDLLEKYLEENNKEMTEGISQNNLKPGKLYFTVNKKGKIKNINVTGTSGFEFIDNNLKNLISNAPGEWIPAENSKGEKVDQELVLSFGMVGC